MSLNPYHFNHPPFHWNGPFPNIYNIDSYGAVGDGVTDDRAAIKACFDEAILNMPCIVQFGTGDYGISGGMQIEPPQGARGLIIKGMGATATRVRFNGSGEIQPGQFIAFAIRPTGTPVYQTYSTYLKDVIIQDIGFYDDDPITHQFYGTTVETGTSTSGGATTMTDSGASFADYSGGYQIRNIDDGSIGRIVSNTGTEITVTGMYGGTNNTWGTDAYEIAINTQIEESHAIQLKYCINGQVRNCHCDSIGDEGWDFGKVEQGILTGNSSVNTPSAGGAGVINVSQGSRSIVISDNRLAGSTVSGTISGNEKSSGIAIEQIAEAQVIEDIVVANNTVVDFGQAGVTLSFAFAGTQMNNLSFTGNAFNNCDIGIERTGVQPLENLLIAGNTFENGTTGIQFATGSVNSNIVNNNFDTFSSKGISGIFDEINMQGNNFEDITNECIEMQTGSDNITIVGGVMDNCGTTARNNVKCPAGSESSIEGVMIVNAASTTSVITAVKNVKNNTIVQTAAENTQIATAKNVVGNSINGGIRTTGVGGIISNNNIIATSDLGNAAILMTAAKDDYIISNNYIVTTDSRYAIDIPTGCDGCLILGNHVANAANGIRVNAGASGGFVDGNKGSVSVAGYTEGTNVA